SIANAARRRIRGVAWRQWLTVLVGAAVVVAMVLVAETARRDSERHLRAQVLVERVRTQGQAVGALDWHAIAILAGRDSRRPTITFGLVNHGWAAWSALSGALSALRAVEPGATANQLQRDALGLYTVGRNTLTVFMVGDVKDALAMNDTVVQPRLHRLDADARRAAARQQTIANQSSRRAGELDVGSVLVGLFLLFLVGWRLHRVRRFALLAEA